MNGEILSIETAQKIARLEKENQELSNIVIKFDKEVNKLFNIIKDAYEYVDKRLLCAEAGQEERLKNILGKGLNKDGDVDAKTIQQ